MHTPHTTATQHVRVIESQQVHAPDGALPASADAQSQRFAALLRLHRDAMHDHAEEDRPTAATQHSGHAEEACDAQAAWPRGDIAQSFDQAGDEQHGEQEDEAPDEAGAQPTDALPATVSERSRVQVPLPKSFDRTVNDAPIAAPDPAQRAHQFIRSIVVRVADFCGDPAVLSRGEWRVCVPIDASLLPACTLDLTLSHFDLDLRFETTSDASRQLISQHVHALRTSLEALLCERQIVRGIAITIT
jgi:hypothetical protein